MATPTPPVVVKTPVKWGTEFAIGGDLQISTALTGLRSGQFIAIGMRPGEEFNHSFDIGVLRHWGNGQPVGSAAYANTNKVNTQYSPEATTLSNGSYVVVWQSADGPGFGSEIKGQVFRADGVKVGAEFRANTTLPGEQQLPEVTALSNGKFLVSWGINASNINQTNAQIFNADGSRFGAALNIHAANDGFASTGLAGGGFAAVWRNASDVLVMQRFSSTGAALGGEVTITSGTGFSPKLATLANGNLVVTWSKNGEVFAKAFNGANGLPESDGGEVSDSTTAQQSMQDVIAIGGNTCLVTWVKSLGGGNVALLGRVIDDDGNSSSVFQINTGVLRTSDVADSRDYDLTLLADGRVAVSWTRGTTLSLRAQIIDPRDEGIIVIGTGGADSYFGTKFADRFVGGGGADRLTGGLGNDTYSLGADTTDIISDSGGVDTIESTISRALAATPPIENITLLGSASINATGNARNNVLTGNAGNNILTGLGGNDTLDPGRRGIDRLDGGAGNDTYVLGARTTGISIVDSSGIDTITSTISRSLAGFPAIEKLILLGAATVGTGNGLANTITGNALANVLNGKLGADRMIGGPGNDIVYVDRTTDMVIELAGGGIADRVRASTSYTLGAAVQVEFLETASAGATTAINLTGNNFANTLTGNAGNNILTGLGGHDRLNAGSGVDTLRGGLGDDTYDLNSQTNDVVSELAGQGTDTVLSSISRSLSLPALVNIDNLTLTGVSAINGTGNALVNTITGNGNTNILDGGGGGNDGVVDILSGGLGNDMYVLGAGNDTVIDSGGAVDTITSSISRNLLSQPGYLTIENLVLTDDNAADGTGNALNNSLTGNDGANVLNGSAGQDTLVGNGGPDVFAFGFLSESAPNAPDTIIDFNSAQGDKIDLSHIANVEFNDPLTFIGTAAFTADGNAAEVRYALVTGGIELQVNRSREDGGAELAIFLAGISSIAGTDIILA